MYEILQATKVVTDNIDNRVKQIEEALGAKAERVLTSTARCAGKLGVCSPLAIF